MASSEFLHQSLDEGAESDLKIIVSDLPATAKASVLAKPYYVIDEFEEFKGDTAMVFQAKAVIVFFYLDLDLNLCQIRKYRFKRSAKSWERYEVELKHIPQKFTAPVLESN